MCEPISPAPPVTSAFILFSLVIDPLFRYLKAPRNRLLRMHYWRTRSRTASRRFWGQAKSFKNPPEGAGDAIQRNQCQKDAERIDAASHNGQCSQAGAPDKWKDVETAEDRCNQKQKKESRSQVFARPVESTEVIKERIEHESVKDVGTKKRDARAVEPECAYADPGKGQTNQPPSQFGHEIHRLPGLGHDYKAHRPGNYLEDSAQANPAKNSHRSPEFSAVEKCDDDGSKGEGGHQARASQQQTDSRLFVDQAIALRVVGGAGRQTRVEIRAHGLQDKSDVQATQSPRRLIVSSGFESHFAQQNDSNHISHPDSNKTGGHEDEAKLQKSVRFLENLGSREGNRL